MDTTELSQRLFDAALGAIDMWSVYVGEKLGLYAALVQRGSLTSAELAAAARIDRGWPQYGPDMRTGQADMNRPWFLGALGTDWFPAVPDLDQRLRAGALVADIGCGEGWSSIAIALAYPDAAVDGQVLRR